MLKIAHRQHLIPYVATAGIRYPIEGMQHREKRVLTLDQYHSLLAEARDIRERTMFRTMCEAGLRCGETLGLQVQDLNLEAGYIHVQRRYYRIGGGQRDENLPKNGKKRIVAINASFIDDLREHIATFEPDPAPDTHLWSRCNRFTSFETAPLTGNSIAELLRRAAKLAGLVTNDGKPWVTPHVLRASGASIAVTAGVSPLIAMEQLGHASLSTTEKHYLQVPSLAAMQGYGAVFE